MTKIDKLNKKSKEYLEILEVKTDNKIKYLELNNKLNKAIQNKSNIEYQNYIINHENGIFKRLKSNGFILSCLSFLSFIVSSLLSIISGYVLLGSNIKLLGYICIILVCQIIIFVSAKYSTITKERFFHRYLGLKSMQTSMLFVSLVMNVIFVHECYNSFVMDVILFPLCFVIDYSTIYFSGLGYDYKTLTFNSKCNKTIIEMIIDNLLFSFKNNVITTYNNNHDVISNECNDVISNVISSNGCNVIKLEKRNVISSNGCNDLITKIDDYIKNNYNCNEKIRVKEVKEIFGLKPNDRKWNDKIRDNLKFAKIIDGKLQRIKENDYDRDISNN